MHSHENDMILEAKDVTALKVALGESVENLFLQVEGDPDGYESEQSTYTFCDEAFIDGTWLPVEVENFLLQQSTQVKKVDVSYDIENVRPRPQVTITLYLTNGERLVLHKDPADYRNHGFVTDYSDEAVKIPETHPHDVGRLLVTLLFAKQDKPDITVARMLSDDNTTNLDPTGPILAGLVPQLLDIRADSWKKEGVKEYFFEDDRYGLTVTKTTDSDDTILHSVAFAQSGTDISQTAKFNLLANKVSYGSNDLTLPTSLDYERYDIANADKDESGSADDLPHLYDYMKIAIDTSIKHVSEPVSQPSLEAIALSLEAKQAERRRYDP